MSTTLTPPTPAAPGSSAGPILDTSVFVNRHGRGLCDLVDILDDTVAIDAFCDLVANHNGTTPCPIVSRCAIETISDVLSRLSVAEADHKAAEWDLDINAAVRWYGARLTELRAKFA